MSKSMVMYALTMAVLGGMAFRCTTGDSPTGPGTYKVPGTTIVSEAFEGDLSEYRQVVYTDGQALMSLSKQYAHTGSGALTSDSNNTSIKGRIEPYIEDSIAGLQFYLMATKAAHTNFFAALCKPGSAKDGLVTKFGIGIDTSDSLKYIHQDNLNGFINEHKNFAAPILYKWYKCQIEYDYSDTTLTYSVDDKIIFTGIAPSPTSIQAFIVVRDELGAQGPSGYYLDNITIYKRGK